MKNVQSKILPKLDLYIWVLLKKSMYKWTDMYKCTCTWTWIYFTTVCGRLEISVRGSGKRSTVVVFHQIGRPHKKEIVKKDIEEAAVLDICIFKVESLKLKYFL